MTTKRVTVAQIQSQLEEARAIIDRQRNEIASLKEEVEKLKEKATPSPAPTAWERIKKEWRRCDAQDYYKLASFSPGAKTLALQAQEEMTRLNKRMYVSTSNGEVYVAVRK